MFYVSRASCCHEPVLSHSPWASILCGKESYGLLRPRRPASDVSSLVPVIYIRVCNVARGALLEGPLELRESRGTIENYVTALSRGKLSHSRLEIRVGR